ncbi:MAG TPA: hypothetical protein IAA30_05830 [Candidatus Treponema faecavium]|nr:hypothetical protein [Candidatus Treponema faecavium]
MYRPAAQAFCAAARLSGFDITVNEPSAGPPETTVPGGEDLPEGFTASSAFIEAAEEALVDTGLEINYTEQGAPVYVPLTETSLETIRRTTSVYLFAASDTDISGHKYLPDLPS